MNEPAALQIEFRPSRIAAALTLLGVVATAGLVAWLPAEPWQRLVAVTVLGVYGVALLRSWAQRTTRRAVVAIALGANRHIAVVERGGRRVEGGSECLGHEAVMATSPNFYNVSRPVALKPTVVVE